MRDRLEKGEVPRIEFAHRVDVIVTFGIHIDRYAAAVFGDTDPRTDPRFGAHCRLGLMRYLPLRALICCKWYALTAFLPELPATRPAIGDVPVNRHIFGRADNAFSCLDTSAELAAAIVLQRHGTIVIMEACKLSSRRRVESTACAVLP